MKRIGIATFYGAYNYGAFFQQYALQQFLQSRGFEADILNYETPLILRNSRYSMNLFRGKNQLSLLYRFFLRNRWWREKLRWQKRFRACIRDELKVSEPFSYEKKDLFNRRYDCFIAGSDQVWNRDLTMNDDFFFLDFADDPRKKASYAASLGAADLGQQRPEVFAELLRGFHSVLVREESGRALLEGLGVPARVALDPVFLPERELWLRFAEKSRAKRPEKYVFVYVVQPVTDLMDLAAQYAREHGCELILVNAALRDLEAEGRKVRVSIDVSPYDFLDLLLHAEAVFTTSFHGLALSIRLNREFYYELSRQAGNRNTRLENLAELCGLTGREITGKALPGAPISWEEVNARVDSLRERSARMLLDSLE